MMETTLKNNNFKGLFSVYKWSLSRYKAPTIVLAVLLFCAGPLVAILTKLLDANLKELNGNQAPPIRHIYDIGCMYYSLSGLVVLFFTLFIAVTVFGYLHKKRSMDTFASLPVSRRTFFFGRYLAGLTMLLVPMLFNFLLTFIITATCDLGESGTLLTLFKFFFILICIVLASYSLTSFIAVCCGTSASTVVSTIIINGAYPIVIYLATLMFTISIPGNATSFSSVFFLDLPIIALTALAPYFSFTQFFPNAAVLDVIDEFQLKQPAYMLEGCIYLIMFTVVFTLLAMLLIKKRKSECAQSGFAFKVPVYAIRLITSVAAGLLTGGIFVIVSNLNSSYNVYFPFAIGAFIGAFLAHLIVTVIFNAGFRGFLKSLISYGVSMVLITAWCLIVVTGFFNYDIYVPSESSIASVNITSRIHSYDDDYMNTPIINFTYTDNFDKITDIHRDISNNLRNTYHYPYLRDGYLSSNYSYTSSSSWNYSIKDGEYSVNDIQFEYTLKSGQKITKRYDGVILDYSINKKIQDLVNTNYNEHLANNLKNMYNGISDTYMDCFVNIYNTPKHKLAFSSYNDDGTFLYYNENILKALAKDIRADKNLTFEVDENDKKDYPYIYIERIERMNSNISDSYMIIVKDSYTNTLKEIEKLENDKALVAQNSYFEDNLYNEETNEYSDSDEGYATSGSVTRGVTIGNVH